MIRINTGSSLLSLSLQLSQKHAKFKIKNLFVFVNKSSGYLSTQDLPKNSIITTRHLVFDRSAVRQRKLRHVAEQRNFNK